MQLKCSQFFNESVFELNFLAESRKILQQGRRFRKIRNLEVQSGFREGTQREVRAGWNYVHRWGEPHVGLDARRVPEIAGLPTASGQEGTFDGGWITLYDLASGLMIRWVLDVASVLMLREPDVNLLIGSSCKQMTHLWPWNKTNVVWTTTST